MGKGDRRHKARKRFEELAGVGLAVKSKPKPARDDRGAFVANFDPDPQATVLDARVRHNGLKDREEAREVALAIQPGQAVWHATRRLPKGTAEREHRRLWQTFAGLDAACEAYHRRYLGQGRFPKTAKIEVLPEKFEARPDDRPDLRTEEEKARDAVSIWMRWHGYIGRLHPHERKAIWDGVYLRRAFVVDGSLTTAGMAFVAALRVLAGEVEKR